MQDPKAASEATAAGPRAGPSGRSGVPVQPVNRSHLLRRPTRFPFTLPYQNGVVRIRRERRVFESFVGIPSLARDPR
jgi:hypothetical protein